MFLCNKAEFQLYYYVYTILHFISETVAPYLHLCDKSCLRLAVSGIT